MDSPLDRAIKAAGSAVALSKALGCTPQAIYQWDRVPGDRVLAVEAATGIARHELRPDLYPPPDPPEPEPPAAAAPVPPRAEAA